MFAFAFAPIGVNTNISCSTRTAEGRSFARFWAHELTAPASYVRLSVRERSREHRRTRVRNIGVWYVSIQSIYIPVLKSGTPFWVVGG